MFRRLLPREVGFFDFFEQHAVLITEACSEFLVLTQGGANNEAQAARLKEIEHQADKITHTCINALNHTFITPIDRVDIHQLIKRLDDIIDSVDATSSRILLYDLVEMRPEAQQLAEILLQAAKKVEVVLKKLRKPGDGEDIQQHLIAIHQFENDGDAVLRAALTRLFKEDNPPILVIKWKEIFERLEKATDRCEEVANLIEKIVIEAS